MTFFELCISGATRSLSFMASSSHFFLQISPRSMQNGGGEGGFLHKPAFRPLLHTKVFSRIRSPGVRIPPSAYPTPDARPDHQHIPLVAGPAETRANGSGGEKRGGRGRLRPRGAEGGGGKIAADTAGRAEDTRRARQRGQGVGGAGGGWARVRRRLSGARPSAARPDEAEAAPSPSPPPPRGLGPKTKTGDKAPSPDRAR